MVKDAVLSMDEPDKEIFLRRYYYCQSLEAISEEMEMNLSTLKSRLLRGKEKPRNTP